MAIFNSYVECPEGMNCMWRERHETSRKVKIMRPAVTAVTVAAVRAKQMQHQARPLRPFRL